MYMYRIWRYAHLLGCTVYGGNIYLRNWSEHEHGPRKSGKPLSRNQKKAKDLLYKTKRCWFYSQHPQGCPRRARDCPYAHGDNELRERPNFGEALDCSKELASLTWVHAYFCSVVYNMIQCEIACSMFSFFFVGGLWPKCAVSHGLCISFR